MPHCGWTLTEVRWRGAVCRNTSGGSGTHPSIPSDRVGSGIRANRYFTRRSVTRRCDKPDEWMIGALKKGADYL